MVNEQTAKFHTEQADETVPPENMMPGTEEKASDASSSHSSGDDLPAPDCGTQADAQAPDSSSSEEAPATTTFEEKCGNDAFVEAILGQNMEVRGHKMIKGPDGRPCEETWTVFSKSTSAVCPCCGAETFIRTSGTTRTLQDIPITPGVKTSYEYHLRVFKCDNPKCSRYKHGFTEPLEKAGKHCRMTMRLFVMLIVLCTLAVGLHGLEGVSRILGIDISDSTLSNMLQECVLYDNPDVEVIGVDDISNRRGRTYFTVIYDYKTGVPLAILQGRDGSELRKWLLRHPCVKKVCRDRASAYSAAIDAVCGELCIQVADRFHLFENFFDHAEDLGKANMPEAIAIKDGQVLDSIPEKTVALVDAPSEEELSGLTYDDSVPVDEDGTTVVVSYATQDPNSAQAKKQMTKRQQKRARVILAQELYNSHPEMSDSQRIKLVAQELNIAVSTAKKWVAKSEEEIENLLKSQKTKPQASKLDGFKNILYKMIRDDVDFRLIIGYVMSLGCEASAVTICTHIEAICRTFFPNHALPDRKSLLGEAYEEGAFVLTRSEILQDLCTHDDEKKNPLVEVNLEVIKQKYPVCGQIQQLFTDYHSLVMGGDPDALPLFIEKYKEVPYFSGFCKRLEQDSDAIVAAITCPESSGPIEGSNNKVKVLKRAMYGRSGRSNLERRAQLAFLVTSDIFSLDKICPRYYIAA